MARVNSETYVTVSVCGGCGDEERPDAPMRRGRCRRCYEKWVQSRPVGLGAFCNACCERRHDALRNFELRQTWVVLCYNCAARADRLNPAPYSIDGLRLKLHRERRWGRRRLDVVGSRGDWERRDGDRRKSERNIADLTEFAEMVIELDAEFADEVEQIEADDGPLTGVFEMPSAPDAPPATD